MNATVEDLRPTIVPKSDQLNAEQLLGGPMTVTVTEVRVGGGEEQPVIVHYANEDGRPFKPCKTMRKVLIHAWGPNGTNWVGRSMTLYNDHSVKWAGEEVGGIRISHMTDIQQDIKVSLTTTRGKKGRYEIKRLTSRIAGQLADIAGSPTLAALKNNYEAAYKSTKDPAERDQLTAAKDKRKAELQKPVGPLPPSGPDKTLSKFKADIDDATSAETASLVLDEARDVLTPAEYEELGKAFAMAWEA